MVGSDQYSLRSLQHSVDQISPSCISEVHTSQYGVGHRHNIEGSKEGKRGCFRCKEINETFGYSHSANDLVQECHLLCKFDSQLDQLCCCFAYLGRRC